MQKQKGFTIIELIVVIAIIAVLAAIVLVNVTQYINKGKDAAIQGDLASVVTNAAVAIDNNTAMADVCTNTTIESALAAADDAYDGNGVENEHTACVDSTTAWAACGQLKAGGYFCVDSNGTKKTVAGGTCTPAAFTGTACP